MYGPPVDYSFRNISLSDAIAERPTEGLRPLQRTPEKKYISRSLRLNNNLIEDLGDLHNTIARILAEPWQLAWLDLSFNRIARIDPVLCELRELRVLYLHGNRIRNLLDVNRLGVLPFLHTITLHGNTIVGERGYRSRDICPASFEDDGFQRCDAPGTGHGSDQACQQQPLQIHPKRQMIPYLCGSALESLQYIL